MKNILRWILLVVFFLVLTNPAPAFAQATATKTTSGGSNGEKLDAELKHWKDKGSKGYLIWQYSGDQNNPLGDTDKYSIFRQNLGNPGDPTSICGGMKKWAGQFELLGYNVYSLGNGRGGPLSSGQIADHLNALKSCGTNVVRVFISRSCPGNVPECVSRMLSGAASAGVKLILTVGDFANGGGGFPKLSRDQVAAWYNGGYKSSAYPQILAQTIQAARGNGALYGVELANEPHCYDDASAVSGYNQWARSGLSSVKGAGIGNAGLGQMGNNPRSSCDGPNTNLIPGNKQGGATMVSSHYYSDAEKAQADIAADKVNAAGMKFYIGEAPLAGFLSTSCGAEEWGCKVSFGEVLDNTAGTAPWRVHDVTNTKPTTGSTVTTQGIDIDKSKLFLDVKELYGDNVPFADFTKDDNKLSEALDPRSKGSLIPAALQEKVAYPNQQVDYPGYQETYAAGCSRASIATKTEDPNATQEKTSYDALQSKQLPDAYPRTQAHYNILGAIRGSIRPNEIKGTGLAWKVEKKEIVDETEGGGFTINQDHKADLFHCDVDQEKRQVPSVEVPVEGFIGQVLAAVTTLVNNVLNLITGTVCTDEERKDCYSTYGTRIDILKTATVFSPGSIDLENKSTGETKGSLLTIFPQQLADGLRKANAGTNKTETGGNVLGISAEEDVPHYQMYTVKKGFQLASSCMLMPASTQTGECTLEPAREELVEKGFDRTPTDTSKIDVTVPLDTTEIHSAIREATAGRIPVCVLEGVLAIEQRDKGWRPTTECNINKCSAAGPFQITVGINGEGDTSCRSCSSHFSDGSRRCPDGWPNNWPLDKNAASPCNVKAAAAQAVLELQSKASYWMGKIFGGGSLTAADPKTQRNAIIVAGNSYYGTDKPTTYESGCSYGESVYKKCDPSYRCGTGNVKFPF